MAAPDQVFFTAAHSASRSMKLRWLLLQFLAAPLTAQVAPRPFQATDYYRLTFVGEPRLAPDARRVAFTVTTAVEDKDRRHSEIWMAATDGSAPPFRYTSPATEASSPVWSADGTLLAFASKREGFDDDVWFLRTGTPGGEAFQIRGVHALPLFSPDGKSLLYGWRGAEPDSLKQQAWRSRVSPLAITRGPDVKRFDGRVYTSLPLVEDERGLVAPRETRRPRHLYLVPPSGGEPRQLTDGDLSQIDPAWSPDGRAVAFVQDSTETQEVRAQVRPQLYVLAIADGTIRRIATPYTESHDPAWSPDGKAVAFICSKGRGEENAVCVVPETGGGAGADRRLTTFNDSLVAGLATIPADSFWFPSVGGLRVEAFLMRPYGYRAGKSYPLILYVHGGPHWNYGNVFFPDMQVLAGQGYWVLLVNPRGSTGYGHEC